MKGIVFAGCSFTWGHGLWYYSENENIPFGDRHMKHFMTKNSYQKYREISKFPRLVANHFETFDVTKNSTAGCEDTSFYFLEELFKMNKEEEQIHKGYVYPNDKYDYNEIEYVIFQTSFPDRNELKIIKDGKEIAIKIHDIEFSNLVKHLMDNGFTTYEEYIDELVKQKYEKIKEMFIFFESKGVKCLILSMTNHYLKLISEDEWMYNRFINLKYENKEYTCFVDLMDNNQNLIIKYDYEYFGEKPPDNLHPSKKCHKIIAENIIRKIEENEKTNQLGEEVLRRQEKKEGI
jgi:hypothetical protein